jgi:hypothetical protein
LTPLLNTLTRIFCDPSLKQKLAFWNRQPSESVVGEEAEAELKGKGKGDPQLLESLIDRMNNDNFRSALEGGIQTPLSFDANTKSLKKATSGQQLSNQIYDRLTQTETLNVWLFFLRINDIEPIEYIHRNLLDHGRGLRHVLREQALH